MTERSSEPVPLTWLVISVYYPMILWNHYLSWGSNIRWFRGSLKPRK
jgi:hypothetical protein